MGLLPIPYFAHVSNGFPRGGQIELHGEIAHGPEQAVWFELRTDDGIAVHVNVRFGLRGEHVVVFNSYEHRKWKHEERHKMTFRPGQLFHLIVSNDFLHWKIRINGEAYHFGHRLSASDITRVEIRGDLHLNSLNFNHLDGHINSSQPIPSAVYQPHFTPYEYQPSGFTDFSGNMVGAGGGTGGHHGGGVGAGGGYNSGYNPNQGVGAGGGGGFGVGAGGGGVGAGVGAGGGGVGVGSGGFGSGGGVGAGGGYNSGYPSGGGVGVGAGHGVAPLTNLLHGGGIGVGAGGPVAGGIAGGVGVGAGQSQFGHNHGPHPTGPPGPQPTGPYGNHPRPSGPY